MILVVDFGSQVAHLIARRIRELNVYSELIQHNTPIERILMMKPHGIILSGGPSSVYESNAPSLDVKTFDLNVPVLGICYGHQLMAQHLGGVVAKGKGEYGKTLIKTVHKSKLLNEVAAEEIVWMSHSDYVERVPNDFIITSYSENNYVSSMENIDKQLYSVQFHPEVFHTPKGKHILNNFIDLTGSPRDWSLEKFVEKKIAAIKNKIGKAKVLMGVSGGVDSTVSAELIHRAIGENLHCVFVNNGLLREGEYEEVCEYFERYNFNFFPVNSTELFLSRLKGVIDPEEKRRIIGNTFIEVFEQQANEIGKFQFLGQGTIYPDRIESAQPSSQASTIKTHHNVGGLPEKMNLDLIEPLMDLYKDEVREVGRILEIDENLLNRHPFPGPGLAVRIIGEITPNRLRIVRQSDHILTEELKKQGLYYKSWQVLTAFLNIKTVGVMGDARSYQYPIVIRCVESTDAMTASASSIPIEVLKKIGTRIVNEVDGVNRVFYDLTDKPPATIEYE
ncbi:MAG: glutamine-hydrolyzing GMP synthase [Promethearchaeota archaeon]